MYKNNKRYYIGLLVLHMPLFLLAQRQYDYMDDSAVAGGADRALNAFIVIIILIIAAIVFVFVGNAFFNLYYWFNPEANPENKKAKRLEEKKKEEERVITQKRKDAIPEAVDLGLSVKWASFNLGAYKPSDTGSTFHWGENNPSTDRRIKTNKFNVNAIGDISGNPDYDAATNLLGDHWRIPTPEECDELLNQCIWEGKEIDGVEGRLITGPSGHSIFLPYNQIDYTTNKLKAGNYWTSYPSFRSQSNDTAQDLRFGEGYKYPADLWNTATASACLFGIRPVYGKSRKKTKEEKQQETLKDFSQIPVFDYNELDTLYKSYEEQSIIREDEKKKLFDSNNTFEENTITDEYGVVYSLDGRRLLYGGDCCCEIYAIKEGTEFICSDAFNTSTSSFSYLFPKKEILKKILLPSSLIYLTRNSICDNCEIESRSPYYSVVDKLVIDNRKRSVIKCLDKFVNEVTIGEPIEEIGPRAFINCDVLRKVSLPNSLKIINENAFRNNEMLEMVNLPDSIETIEEDAFFCCKSLLIDRLPKNLIRLGNSAFNHCKMDGSVIPCNIAFIGNAPFPKSCVNLQSLSDRFVIKDGLLIDEKEKSVIQLVDNSILNVTIPINLTKIGSNAFHHCDIEAITIPENIVEIGSGIFWGCKNITKVTFKGRIRCIPRIAFAYCDSLTSISLPTGVEIIESAAFDTCKNLETINLNDDLQIISNNAFINCPNLRSLTIPESVEVIGEKYGSSFQNCPNLDEFNYGARNATVTGIPGSIKTLTIGDHVEVLPRWLVPSNSNIDSLTIPECVRKVCSECIMGGANLKVITILSRNIELEDGWLKNCANLRKIVVYADMYETLLPRLPQREGLKIEKKYPHHFMFFKW